MVNLRIRTLQRSKGLRGYDHAERFSLNQVISQAASSGVTRPAER
jgi:hypothetical protein